MLLQKFLTRSGLGLLAALLLGLSLFSASPAFAGAGPAGTLALTARSKAWGTFVRQPSPAAAGLTIPSATPAFLPHDLAAFIQTVTDGQAGVLRGVYVRDVLALQVVHQPAGGTFFVDLTPGTATQYDAASAYGVTGLLADNVASGTEFYDLQPGQVVNLIYGDGALRQYVVTTLDWYQALSPTSPHSDFVHLATGAQISANALFAQMYTGGDRVTLQTCVAKDGVMSWGRLFVTAVPAN